MEPMRTLLRSEAENHTLQTMNKHLRGLVVAINYYYYYYYYYYCYYYYNNNNNNYYYYYYYYY